MLVDVPLRPTTPSAEGLPSRTFLRSAVAVAPVWGRSEWVAVHFASGSIFRTDELGAIALRALIDGRSIAEAAGRAERLEPGTGDRARQLIDLLASRGAMTSAVPDLTNLTWRLRRRCMIGIGWLLGFASAAVRVAPLACLRWAFGAMRFAPLTHHVWRTTESSVGENLRSAGLPLQKCKSISRVLAAETLRNYSFFYLSAILTPERLGRLADRLFDTGSMHTVVNQLDSAGPMIVVFLHTPLCIAVPNAVRSHGRELTRTIAGHAHGLNVSLRGGTLRDFFGDPGHKVVDANDPFATGAMLRHLAAGRSVYLALDRIVGATRAASVQMFGQDFARNDGPSWLAVRSGRPIALWMTFTARSRIVVQNSAPLSPNSHLPIEHRVAELTERLYSLADAALRDHPEGWGCWTYLDLVRGNRR